MPEFGLAAGINPTGTGDCDGIAGANGQPIKIPCSCPPDRNQFIAVRLSPFLILESSRLILFSVLQDLSANVAAGHAVNNSGVTVAFPTDASKASQAVRIQAALVTLQNLNGQGVGCPASSTTFSVCFFLIYIVFRHLTRNFSLYSGPAPSRPIIISSYYDMSLL